jgi:type IV pilus assembly protein PilP
VRTLGVLGAVAALIVLAACGEKKAPARPTPTPAPPAPAVTAEVKPSAPAGDWSYSSVGKRDPFRSFLAELAANKTAPVSRCVTPLGRFDIDQLKLVAVVTGLEDPVAMAEAPNGIGYALRRGACIGRNGGVISAVRTGEVVIAEWVVRADGTRERTQVLLRLPKEPALDIEE